MDIAANLHLDLRIPAHQEKLKKFLSTLVSDTDWDESKEKQAGLKAMGETRYHINLESTFSNEKQMESHTEKVSTSAASSAGSGQLPLEGGKLEVNIECPDWVELSQRIKVLESGEIKMARGLQEMNKLQVQLSYCTDEKGIVFVLG
jgi:hypothetical protein